MSSPPTEDNTTLPRSRRGTLEPVQVVEQTGEEEQLAPQPSTRHVQFDDPEPTAHGDDAGIETVQTRTPASTSGPKAAQPPVSPGQREPTFNPSVVAIVAEMGEQTDGVAVSSDYYLRSVAHVDGNRDGADGGLAGYGRQPTTPLEGSFASPSYVDVPRRSVSNLSEVPRRTVSTLSAMSGRTNMSRGGFLSRSLIGLPQHLRALYRSMKQLHPGDLLLLLDAGKKSVQSVYSDPLYSGENWYLPNMRREDPTKAQWRLSTKGIGMKKVLVLVINGMRIEFNLLSYLTRIALIVLMWFMLWTILPKELMQPGGVVFDPLMVLVVSTIVGGLVARLLQVPPMITILWMGIMWNSVPGNLTAGIVPEVTTIARSFGLTIVLLRAGISFSIPAVAKIVPNAMSLSLLPLVVDATVHALVANEIFGYNNYTWAFLHGFVVSPASPAVVVPGVLYIQSLGHGNKGGPTIQMICGAPLDTCMGIWAINFITQLLFNTGTSLALAIALGPIQIIGGIIVGGTLGYLVHYMTEYTKSEANRMADGKYSATFMDGVNRQALIFVVFFGVTTMFLGSRVSLAGGASVCIMTMGATITHRWMNMDPDNKELIEQRQALALALSDIYTLVAQPILFSFVGAAVDLGGMLEPSFLKKAIPCLLCSMGARFLSTFPCTLGTDYSWQEKVLLGTAWLAKATVQAALGGLPLVRAKEHLAAATTPEEVLAAQGEIERSQDIKNIAILSVLICCPLSAMVLKVAGPRVVRKDPPPA